MMDWVEPSGFLDVSRLLESSRPRPRINPLWWLGAAMLSMALGIRLMHGGAGPLAGMVATVLLAAVIGGFSLLSMTNVRKVRAEHQQVERIGELVQLRRWPDAAVALEQYLSRPARAAPLRMQALLYLAPVLNRLKRFGDAIAVQDYLLQEGVSGNAGVMLRIGRAMAMLYEDHLFDADRAISELRRGPAAGSAPLAMLEIYRDVKTGHPAEAVELFEKMAPTLRDELGARVADAWALAARAYDLLGRTQEAGRAFHNATLLAPVTELLGRYPELEKLRGRYQPAPAPAEAR